MGRNHGVKSKDTLSSNDLTFYYVLLLFCVGGSWQLSRIHVLFTPRLTALGNEG